ncbi:hypothetical protein E4U43_006059, partial [Claviceps pusilla]
MLDKMDAAAWSSRWVSLAPLLRKRAVFCGFLRFSAVCFGVSFVSFGFGSCELLAVAGNLPPCLVRVAGSKPESRPGLCVMIPCHGWRMGWDQ